MKSESFQRTFLLLLVAVVTFVFLWMLQPFLMTMLMAAIFAGLVRPLYLKFLRWTKNRQRLSSGLTLATFVFVLILPLISFIGIVANEAFKVAETAAPWVQDKLKDRDALNESLRRLPGFKYITPYSEQILDKMGAWVTKLGNLIFTHVSMVTTGTLVFLFNFAIMLYAMYFFLIHGPAILDKILYYLPLKHSDEKKLLEGFQSMARATVKGLIIVGVVQGTLGGLALWAGGVPSPLFWGTVMTIMSMVPNIGTALVWVPACIYLFIRGEATTAAAVFLWCAIVVGTIDNILRPILVGKDTEMPELLILLSTLGGLALFGLPGFILGPALALVFLNLWNIYGHTFKDVLPKVGEL